MTAVFEELGYNLKKGIFINIILAVQFAVFFWQGTMLSTYFLEMRSLDWRADSVPGNYSYYSIGGFSFSSEEDEEYFRSQSSNPDYGLNLANAFDEIYEDPDLHYMAFGPGMMAMPVYYEELLEKFDDKELLASVTSKPFFQSLRETREVCEFKERYQFDEKAMKHFGFQVSQGRLLSEEDFTFKGDETDIPILIGNRLGEGLRVGDTLGANALGYQIRFRIVGILQAGTGVVTDQIFADLDESGENAEPLSLDNALLVPFLKIHESPQSQEELYFISGNYEGIMQDGMIVVDAGTPRREVTDIDKKLSDIFTKNGLYPVTTSGTTYGVGIFKTESQRTMQILLSAGILIGVLSISGICMSVIAKLNRNMHRYGIEIMNGQSIRPVMGAFLIEILLVISVGMAFNIWKFSEQMRWQRKFLWVILGMAALSVLIVSAVFVRRLRKVDIEEIIRSEE